MTGFKRALRGLAMVACTLVAAISWAADYPAPREGDWIAPDAAAHAHAPVRHSVKCPKPNSIRPN